MDKTTINIIIAYLKNELKIKGILLNDVALFGSQMRGTAAPESDIDIILISDAFQNKNIIERSDITMDAEINTIRKFKIPLDVLKMTQKEYRQGLINKRFIAQLL